MQGLYEFNASESLFAQAKEVIPGGVNSPVRAFGSVGMRPVFIKKARGSRLWDEDDNEYIDYIGSWGPAILGHSHPDVVAAINQILGDGFSYGAPTRLETELVQAVKALVPHAQMLRLVSSGTEACMSVLRLARARTGRKKILKFIGCYHGHADMLLVKAGSGVATLGIPGSPGVPEEATQFTLTASYNDVAGVEEIFRQHGHELAAVIIEPVVGNAGFIRPQPGFHESLRSLCDRYGSLLIFDEVMTGFRVALGGFQALTSVKPDLMTFGKVIGGGMPIGAYGGRRDIMEMVAPAGPVYQAGTLSGNPIAVTCGIKTLALVKASDWAGLSRRTKKLVDGLREEAQKCGIPFSADSEGGMFGFFFRSELPKNFAEASQADVERFVAFFQGMLRRGVYLAPSAFEAGFVSFAHTESDIDNTIATAREVFKTL